MAYRLLASVEALPTFPKVFRGWPSNLNPRLPKVGKDVIAGAGRHNAKARVTLTGDPTWPSRFQAAIFRK
jgi:hypothetical protein